MCCVTLEIYILREVFVCLFVCLGAMGCNPIQIMGPLDPCSVSQERC
jgi:hypothetical protein